MAEEQLRRRLSAIVATDVVGYSRLMGADEVGTLDRLMKLRREVLEPRVQQHGGRIVKTTGDGALIEFASAVEAVCCAFDMQTDIEARERDVADDKRIRVRVGINLGDIIHEGDDVFGDGVNVAARLEQLAEPGGICVSRNIYDEVRDRIAIEHEYLGEREVKNISRRVKVHRVKPGADYRISAGEPASAAVTPGRSHRRLSIIAIAAVVALALFIVAWPRGRAVVLAALMPVFSGSIAPQHVPDLSIAVLPFDSLSGNADEDYVADGITDDLITDLSRISGAFVIARDTSFAYKGKTVDARKVARELHVRHILTGSVRRTGDVTRINAQLIDGQTGAQEWAERFDLPRKDMYTVQDQITGRIARALNVQLKEAVSRWVARGRPENLDAVDLATAAWSILFNKPQKPKTNDEAEPLLKRAIALDPRNAEAWTGLSYMYIRAATYHWTKDVEGARRQAIEAGQRAIELDPQSADARYVLGFAVYRDDLVRARQLFEQCLALNPNYAPAYAFLGLVVTIEGHPKKALELIGKAFQLSPLDGLAAIWRFEQGQAQIILGDDAGALRTAEAGIALNPKVPQNYRNKAAALANLGRVEEARPELARYQKMSHLTTLTQVMMQGAFDRTHPDYYRHFFDGLRAAGMPE